MSVTRIESNTEIRSLSPEDLLASKRAANRASDQADIEFLERLTGQPTDGDAASGGPGIV